jgi:hypothetical protein
MKNYASILATLLVFAAVVVDKMFIQQSAAIADEYHAQIKAAADELPRYFGDWLGTDIPVPEAAVKMLKPNVIISRRFENIRTGEAVNFLFVQTKDARDILGHYPPVCYPGQGWTVDAAVATDWASDEASDEGIAGGTAYTFSREELEGAMGLKVDNLLLLPDGTFCRNMDGVEANAQDRLRKAFGAAQIQFVYSGSIPGERQKQITEEFLRFAEQIVEATGSGEKYVTR